MFIRLGSYLINPQNITHIDLGDVSGDYVVIYFNISVGGFCDGLGDINQATLTFRNNQADYLREYLTRAIREQWAYLELPNLITDGEETPDPVRVLGYVEKYFEGGGNEPPGPESDDIPF